MRRTTFGFVGFGVLVLTLLGAGSALVLQGFAAPSGHAGGARAAAAPALPASPPVATDGRAQPAALMDSVVTPVPASTQLVSPKAGAQFLMYWFDPAQPIMGEMGATTWGGPTFRPVVSTNGNWIQVRLDARPNGSTGWVRRDDVNLTTTAYRIVISVSHRSLTLYQNGWPTYTAPVGVGRRQWPTPVGPSFVDAVLPVPPSQQFIYGPIIAITASHSNVFTTFDGGDGTVAIHGYPSDPASTSGVASSHGCIRASPQTMAAIAQVPPGSPIDFVA